MSHSGPRIGLSDTQLDADLRPNEIDHDFFDNPCGSTSDDSLESDITATGRKKIAGGLLPSDVSIQMEGVVEAACPAPRFLLNLDMTATRAKSEDGLVTPETCIPAPNLQFFPPSHRQISAEGQLASYFSSGIQGFESGPHSSYLMTSGVDCSNGEENLDGSLLCTEEDAQQHPRQKLFDLSSSSSDGENTEDEEFVELLGKYYDLANLDLGDSGTSDLTEISPMSSFSESPCPFFSPTSNAQQVISDHADPVYKTDDKLRALEIVGRSTKLPLAKPLPPLIIHTLEEVPIIRPRPATFAQGFIIPKTEPTFPESLLMVKVNNRNEQSTTDKGKFTDLDPKPTSSSSMSTSNSSSSARSKNDTILGKTASTTFSAPVFDFLTHNNLGYQEDQKNCEDVEDENQHAQEKFARKSAESMKSNHFNQLAHVKGSIHHHRFGYHHHQPVKASATIARQRQQRRIEHENSILVRRLQSVKPSKEIAEAFRSGTNNLKCTF